MSNDNPMDIFTSFEVAHICELDETTIVSMYDAGNIKGFLERGKIKIPRKLLIEFMEKFDKKHLIENIPSFEPGISHIHVENIIGYKVRSMRICPHTSIVASIPGDHFFPEKEKNQHIKIISGTGKIHGEIGDGRGSQVYHETLEFWGEHRHEFEIPKNTVFTISCKAPVTFFLTEE